MVLEGCGFWVGVLASLVAESAGVGCSAGRGEIASSGGVVLPDSESAIGQSGESRRHVAGHVIS
jgi:hypothetical protein